MVNFLVQGLLQNGFLMFIGPVGFNENSTSASGTTYLQILRQSVNYVCHDPNLPPPISHGNTKYVCQALALLGFREGGCKMPPY